MVKRRTALSFLEEHDAWEREEVDRVFDVAKSAAVLLAEQDAWKRDQQELIAKRLTGVEAAVVQINHFTEAVEKLDLGAWKAEIGADMRWLKYLVGVGAAAGLFNAVAEVAKALK